MLLTLHGSTLLLGASALFPHWLALPAAQLVVLRCLLAGAALLAWMRWRGLRVGPLDAPGWRRLLLVSLLLGAHWACYFAAIRVGGVGLAVALVYSYPAWSLLLECWRGRQRPRRPALFATALTVLGISLVAGQALREGAAGIEALALGLVAALLYALRNLVLAGGFRAVSGEALTAVPLLVVGLAGAPLLLGGVALQPGQGWLLLLFATLFTALPHLGVVQALQRFSATRVGLLTSLELPYALGFAWLLLDQAPGAALLAGSVCILAAGLYSSTRALNRVVAG